jgi:hypothetical protein
VVPGADRALGPGWKAARSDGRRGSAAAEHDRRRWAGTPSRAAGRLPKVPGSHDGCLVPVKRRAHVSRDRGPSFAEPRATQAASPEASHLQHGEGGGGGCPAGGLATQTLPGWEGSPPAVQKTELSCVSGCPSSVADCMQTWSGQGAVPGQESDGFRPRKSTAGPWCVEVSFHITAVLLNQGFPHQHGAHILLANMMQPAPASFASPHPAE